MRIRAAVLTCAFLVFLTSGFLVGCHSPLERRAQVAHSAPSPVAQTEQAGQGRVGLIVDVDETISMTDYPSLLFGRGTDDSRPHEHARDVLGRLNRHFDVTYLTARPQWLTGHTRKWLRDKGFPPGIVLTTARMLDVYWPGAFKKRTIAALRRISPNILIGIGDRHTDVEAYVANGMLALVVNPRPSVTYHERAVVLKDWGAIEAFFEEHGGSLREPEALRARYGIGGAPLDPSTVRTQPEVDLSLLFEIPVLVPTLLVESLVKAAVSHEQAEAKRALEQVTTPFPEVLRQVAARFGEDKLLKLRLATERGTAVYVVTFLREGRVCEVKLDTTLETVDKAREIVWMADQDNAVAARAQARLTFSEALSRSTTEVEGQVYEIELEMDDNRPTYETALMGLGRFLEIEVDAGTGEVIEIEDETAIR
jgi:uncharacterized membrane protein YkoI